MEAVSFLKIFLGKHKNTHCL